MSVSTEGSSGSEERGSRSGQTAGQDGNRSVSAMLRLMLACVGFTLLLAGPAWLVAGSKGLVGLSAAALLCLVPGCLVTGFRHLAGDSQAVLLLASGGLRMAFVLMGALVARFGVDGYGLREFFVWLILFYLFTLAIETISFLKSPEGQADGRESRLH